MNTPNEEDILIQDSLITDISCFDSKFLINQCDRFHILKSQNGVIIDQHFVGLYANLVFINEDSLFGLKKDGHAELLSRGLPPRATKIPLLHYEYLAVSDKYAVFAPIERVIFVLSLGSLVWEAIDVGDGYISFVIMTNVGDQDFIIFGKKLPDLPYDSEIYTFNIATKALKALKFKKKMFASLYRDPKTRLSNPNQIFLSSGSNIIKLDLLEKACTLFPFTYPAESNIIPSYVLTDNESLSDIFLATDTAMLRQYLEIDGAITLKKEIAMPHPVDLLLNIDQDSKLLSLSYREGKLNLLCLRAFNVSSLSNSPCHNVLSNLRYFADMGPESNILGLLQNELPPFVGLMCNNIPICYQNRSEQIFRGCTGIWAIKEYLSDSHDTLLIVSFIETTVMLRVQNDFFEDVSESGILEMNSPTIMCSNSISGSYFIQVCPTSVLICKSSIFGSSGGKIVATWTSTASDQEIISAAICCDFIFLLENPSSRVTILMPRMIRDNCAMEVCAELSVDHHAFKLFAVKIPNTSNEFLFAIAEDHFSFSMVTFYLFKNAGNTSETAVMERLAINLQNKNISDLVLFFEEDILKCFIGTRFGTVLKCESDYFSASPAWRNPLSLPVGKRPVLFTLLSNPTRILSLSGNATLIREKEHCLHPENLIHRADFLIPFHTKNTKDWNQTESKTFVAIEHESMVLFETPLTKSQRIERFLCAKDIQFFECLNENQVIVATGDCLKLYRFTDEILSFEFHSENFVCFDILGKGEFAVCVTTYADTSSVKIVKIASEKGPRRKSLSNQKNTLTILAEVGLPGKISKVNGLGSKDDNTFHFILASHYDTYLMEYNHRDMSIEILISEVWRDQILELKSSPKGIIAFSCSTSGLALFFWEKSEVPHCLRKVSTFCNDHSPHLLLWIADDLLVTADRYGIISILRVETSGSHITPLKLGDISIGDRIPRSMVFDPKTLRLYISTASGGYLRLLLKDYLN